MYVVIFRASIDRLDDSYAGVAARLRSLAMERYGCREFTSVTENGMEISISHWDSLEQIESWKRDPEHLEAQDRGKSVWYKSYQIQIAEVIREYGKGEKEITG